MCRKLRYFAISAASPSSNSTGSAFANAGARDAQKFEQFHVPPPPFREGDAAILRDPFEDVLDPVVELHQKAGSGDLLAQRRRADVGAKCDQLADDDLHLLQLPFDFRSEVTAQHRPFRLRGFARRGRGSVPEPSS